MKLHLGCGKKNILGWTNIDAFSEHADMKIDIKNLSDHFNNNSIDEVYACHVFEHFGRHEYSNIFKSIFGLLKPGGVFRISVPDFHACATYYCETLDIDSIYGALYGGQINEFDYHKWCFTYDSLKNNLEELGFKDIKRYDWKTTEHAHQFDWASDYLPRTDASGNMLCDDEWHKGTLVSLNVVAKK